MDVMASMMLYLTMESLVVRQGFRSDEEIDTARTLMLGEAARQGAWPYSTATMRPEGWLVTDGMLKKQPDLGRMGVDNEPDHE